MTNEGKIEILAGWLERQLADTAISDGRIWQDMAVSERTFYRLKPKATEVLNKRLKERQKIIEATKTEEVIQAALNGLKTKNERLLILQGQVDASLIELQTTKKLTIFEKVALRKVIKEMQSEISKIEGDYELDNKQRATFTVNVE